MVDIGRVGIVGGAGWLGTAIARALVRSGTVSPRNLTCSYRSRLPECAIECAWTNDNQQLVENSDIVLLSVRPSDWKTLKITASEKLVISVMAGVSTADLKHRTKSDRVARVLPNAAAEIGYSYTPFYLASKAPADGHIVEAIFGSCGVVDVVTREDHIDYFTAMTGSGAAFPALLADAMMKDAMSRGVSADVALRAAQNVIIGAGRLQEHDWATPTQTVKAFVDYKGTTAAGITAMRQMGFEEAVCAGLEAAFSKAQALSRD